MERTISVWYDPNIRDQLSEGGPLRPVQSFRSVGPKCPFPFDSTALLYPAYKDNNQTRGGFGRCAIGMYRSIGHVGFPKFQTGIAGGGYLG